MEQDQGIELQFFSARFFLAKIIIANSGYKPNLAIHFTWNICMLHTIYKGRINVPVL